MSKSVFRNDLFQSKVALVTGGGSGICYEIARGLGQHGAHVALMGRRKEVLDEAVLTLKKEGIKASAHPGDVRDFDQCAKIVGEVVEGFKSLDILVNGAAGNFLCPTEKLSSNGFKTVLDIDLLGTFNMCRVSLEPLKKASTGVILNISATLHYQGTWMQSHVMAAKAGVDALGRNLACEWAPYGIRVVGIAPGPIEGTEGMRKLAPLGAEKKVIQEIPLGRMGRTQDIAQAAVFLCSEAASFITGETLVVDGGQWLSKPPFVTLEMWEKFSAMERQKSK